MLIHFLNKPLSILFLTESDNTIFFFCLKKPSIYFYIIVLFIIYIYNKYYKK